VPANDAAAIEAVLTNCTPAQLNRSMRQFLRAAVWHGKTQLVHQLRHRLNSVALDW
jgi:hypothetical protein